MHDIKLVRADPEAFDAAMARRGLSPLSKGLLSLDKARREIIQRLEEAQSERNRASKAIGAAKAQGDEASAQQLMDEVARYKSQIQDDEIKRRDLDEALEAALAVIPNRLHDSVPEGASEEDNVEIHRFGERPDFAFPPKSHDDLGYALGMMDFEAASRISGARFVVLKGQLASLERALSQFMLDLHTREHGLMEVSPPTLVRSASFFGTAQLPKFAEDQFQTSDDLWLIPTSEVPLTNLVRESIINESTLPLRFTAHTLCFRREAGSAGRDTRGMIRQHQFAKVEMVSITREEEGLDELERMKGCAASVLERLNLPYRIVTLCSGDIGFASMKTYDFEVWLPSQMTYREISSCSVCGDFQARRMNARYRTAEGDTRFVCTLNGSGLAVGRTLIAVMENYQREDGKITVPEALRPYMGGLEIIG